MAGVFLQRGVTLIWRGVFFLQRGVSFFLINHVESTSRSSKRKGGENPPPPPQPQSKDKATKVALSGGDKYTNLCISRIQTMESVQTSGFGECVFISTYKM